MTRKRDTPKPWGRTVATWGCWILTETESLAEGHPLTIDEAIRLGAMDTDIPPHYEEPSVTAKSKYGLKTAKTSKSLRKAWIKRQQTKGD